MIAYDEQLLQNTMVVESAESLYDGKFISKAQLVATKTAFETLKTNPNLLFRLAFLLLGCFCYGSASGTLALFSLAGLGSHYELLLFVMASVGSVATEMLAKNRYYAHGLDDAAILGALGFLAAALDSTSYTPLVYAIVAIAACVAAIRYLHTPSVVVFVLAMVGLLSDLVISYHIVPEIYLTVVLFAFAVGLYFGHKKLSRHEFAGFYRYPLQSLELCALLLGYFSMNYLVVRELAGNLMGVEVTDGNDIPLAPIFYFLTFAIPVFYGWLSIRQRNKLILWTALATFAFSIFSIRYYYHFMPPEYALLLGGAILATVSLLLIRKLKHREKGITFQKDRFHDSAALSIAQAVIVNSHAIQNVSSKGPMEFGGGGFSGGGAGETF